MAFPYTITNSTKPDADEVMDNFTYLRDTIREYRYLGNGSSGAGTNSSTYQDLKTITPPQGKCTYVTWNTIFNNAGGSGTATGRIQVVYDDLTTDESAEFTSTGSANPELGQINADNGKYITSIKFQGKGDDGSGIPDYDSPSGFSSWVQYNDFNNI